VYSTQLTTIQVILVVLVIKLPLWPKILLILIGSTEEKSNSTRSVDSVSDASFSTYQNGLTSVYDAKHHSRPKPKYTLDYASEDSDYQEQILQNGDECQEQPTKDSSEENSEYEDSVCQGVSLVKGQFCVPSVGFFSIFWKISTFWYLCMYRSWLWRSRQALPNNQGLTKHIQYGLVKKKTIFGLNSQVQYLNIPWATNNGDEYIKAITKINECYRKMLMIGKCNEVFQPSNDKVPDLLSAKTSNEFKLAKENIQDNLRDS
jgi:hypothetical protein